MICNDLRTRHRSSRHRPSPGKPWAGAGNLGNLLLTRQRLSVRSKACHQAQAITVSRLHPALRVHQFVAMRTCSFHSWQLACSCRPSLSCRKHHRGLNPIVCGSKSRRKQAEGRDSPNEGLRERESAGSGTTVEEQSSSSPQLSRSGKPIGWKILPREDPVPVTDIQEVKFMTALPAETSSINCHI